MQERISKCLASRVRARDARPVRSHDGTRRGRRLKSSAPHSDFRWCRRQGWLVLLIGVHEQSRWIPAGKILQKVFQNFLLLMARLRALVPPLRSGEPRIMGSHQSPAGERTLADTQRFTHSQCPFGGAGAGNEIQQRQAGKQS
jgi:hypothetical protein